MLLPACPAVGLGWGYPVAGLAGTRARHVLLPIPRGAGGHLELEGAGLSVLHVRLHRRPLRQRRSLAPVPGLLLLPLPRLPHPT